MTADEFRKMALTFAGTVESAHMNHPDFRIAGRIFATLGSPDPDWGMVNLTPELQGAFVRDAPGVFKPCNGAWGENGATLYPSLIGNGERGQIRAFGGDEQCRLRFKKEKRFTRRNLGTAAS